MKKMSYKEIEKIERLKKSRNW